MNLELNEQQEMLQKSARDFLMNRVSKKLIRDMEIDSKGFTLELWQQMAQLGWQGLVFPEKYGGMNFGFLDLVVLLEEMGRFCLPGPFFSTVVLGGLLIMEAGNDEQKAEYIPKIANGELIATLAMLEVNGSYNPALVETNAVAEDGAYVISGTKLYVTDANVADVIIVVSKTPGGITLFIVDAKSSGIKVIPLNTIAGDKQCEVLFDKVKVVQKNILGGLNNGSAILEKFIQKAAIAKCGEMVGGFQQMFEMTLYYAKTRTAFGKPIGTFQAIQHYCANMAIDLDSSRFMTYKAAWMFTEDIPCAKLVSATKAWVSEAYRRATFIAHQIHGSIGFTMDYDLQLYTRRARGGEMLLGTPQFHREIVMHELGL